MSKFLLSLFFVCATSLVWSQDSQQEKLEQRKAQIQQEIKENERLLQSVKKKEKSAVSVMAIQEKKIALKENLIKTTEKQAKLLIVQVIKFREKYKKINWIFTMEIFFT